jgi:signal transduction histidine kinase/tetratricopeptide (TPR) repeat protein
MLDNLKVVLLQHKKFLIIFFVVVFLPSVVLAFFGISAIYNERYKLQQQNLEQQKGFVGEIQTGILSQIDRNSSKLNELSVHEVFSVRDYPGIHDLISEHLADGSLFGHIVVWNEDGSFWFPGFQPFPPYEKTLEVPEEWKKWQPDLEIAERAEFRRRNYLEAVSQYKKILDEADDKQVKAWILSRIARCEAKREKFKQALNAYYSIITNYPDHFTESGRPLELASRLGMLDAFRLSKDHESFYQESLSTFGMLEKNILSLDGDQIKMYTDILKNMIDDVMAEDASDNVPENFVKSISNIQAVIHKKLGVWQMAEAVARNMLSDATDKLINLGRNGPQVQKNAFEYGGDDILVILIPLTKEGVGPSSEFLGSLMEVSDLTDVVDIQIKENGPVDGSIVLRSSLSHKIIFGDMDANQGSAVITDFFPENFPPWRLELYQLGDGESGFSLYKNIFFWTILALLIILFFGSGLIIRTIIQEVNLLNLKSEFIASVSHEFKTPLTAMGAVLERLLSEEVKDPKKTKEYYRILSHDSERLKRLVKNVLDFTKIEDGKREYTLATTDITRLVRYEVDSFQKENRMSGFSVETKIDDDIPHVFADEEAMSQALHNILDNAVKFSGTEKNIQVKIIRRQNSVEVAVQDRGVGISENEQKKVFEKFYRGKQASSVSPTGTGLGLTLVKHILDGHRGDVVIKSQTGKGTCVSLILPFGKGG